MHKCRENNNGSFSIGKTWDLDNLSKIQSFNNLIPRDPQEQQAKQLAGDVGFTITIQKPYYWRANTSKEKDFFIYSLVKIFKKYTGGKTPELTGFTPAEREQFEGLPSQRSGSPSRTPQSTAAQIEASTASGRPSPSRPERTARNPASETNGFSTRYPLSPEPQAQGPAQRSRPSQESVKTPEASLSPRPAYDRSTDSSEQMPRMPGQFPSSEFVRSIRPQASANLQPIPPETSISNGASRVPSPHIDQSAEQQQRPGSRGRGALTNGVDRPPSRSKLRPQPSDGSIGSNLPPSQAPSRSHMRTTSSSGAPILSTLTPGVPSFDSSDRRNGDRERPKVLEQTQSSLRGFSDVKSASVERIAEQSPPSEQSSIKDSSRPPTWTGKNAPAELLTGNTLPNGDEQDMQQKRNNQPDRSTVIPNDGAALPLQDSTVLLPTRQDQHVKDDNGSRPETPGSTPATPFSPPETPSEETHRPGLGPMIKKRSNKDIANIFRKAATAHNAFKPRAGGAAGKLRDDKDKLANEPDGITGVVPAPNLRSPLPPGVFSPLPMTPDIIPPSPLPKLTTSPPKDNPVNAAPKPAEPRPQTPAPPPIQPKESPTARRPKPKMSHFAKYAKALSIPSEVLEDRTIEVESMLDDFGWGDDSKMRCTFDDLQLRIKQELSRVEAGSYLGGFDRGDDRLATIDDMMNRVVTECEEMDNLLTLYKVELGVSNKNLFTLPLS